MKTESFRVRMDSNGRIVVPSEVRKELNLEPGEALTLISENGEMRILSLREAVRRAQETARKVVGNRTGLVDEFIAERRREAERE